MNEHEIRALLAVATLDRPAGIDLLPVRPPKRRLAAVLVPIASLGAAAALGAVLVMSPVGQPSAQAQVVAAVENVSQESHRLHSVSGTRRFDGAFDPVRRVGVIREIPQGVETRFVGDQMYVRPQPGAKWLVSPRNQVELESAPQAVALVKLAPLDPQAALQRLRSATDVREEGGASGPGWTGRRFAFSLEDAGAGEPGGGQKAPVKAAGTVDVDDQERVRRLEVVFGDGHRVVMTIGDFGAPVSVETPPADQVEPLPSSDKPGKSGETPEKTDRLGDSGRTAAPTS
ncbi:hypothetical protein ACFFMN_14505 [Planobispora siamensis]|uniref:Uncharacterized protein n=1 Tax=Planobispora siamensis TaxID=936338 RepID=A0A8J3S7K7_9ACTN|nr:hypothetical protein [Planobispora siamensis]GIH89422.1 hypothetical protein Psi01_00520 [Planobispora siamensis]